MRKEKECKGNSNVFFQQFEKFVTRSVLVVNSTDVHLCTNNGKNDDTTK